MFKNKLLKSTLLLGVSAAALSSCAILHHVQLGQIDNRNQDVAIPFEVLVSETGINTKEIGDIARSTNSRGGENLGKAADIIGLFQFGPRTGNIVYNERYAERVVYEIYQRCPSGKVTGLMSIREMRKYPVVSGEIVKITGYCLKPKNQAPKIEEEI